MVTKRFEGKRQWCCGITTFVFTLSFFCVLKLFLVDMSLPMSTPFIYERMKNNSLRSFVPTLFQSVHLILIVFIVNSSFSFAENVVFSVCLYLQLSPLFLSLQFLSYHSSIIIFFSGKIFPFFTKLFAMLLFGFS